MKRKTCAALIAAAVVIASCSGSDGGGTNGSDPAAFIATLNGPSDAELVEACEELVGTSDDISNFLDTEVVLDRGIAQINSLNRPSFHCSYSAISGGDASVTVHLEVYSSDEEAVDGASADATDHVGSVTVYLEDTNQWLTPVKRAEAQRAIAERLSSREGVFGREGALRSI
jgi:hypothetical protein